MRGRRGFTLIEGLFSLLLVMLVLGALSQTLVNAGKVRSNRVNMDRAVDELHALNSIRADITGSLQLSAPAISGTSPTVRMTMVNPKLTFPQRIDVLAGPNLPYEPSEQVEVLYRVENGVLQKVVSAPGASPRVLRLLSANRLEASRQDRLVTLTVAFEYSRVEKIRSLKLELR